MWINDDSRLVRKRLPSYLNGNQSKGFIQGLIIKTGGHRVEDGIEETGPCLSHPVNLHPGRNLLVEDGCKADGRDFMEGVKSTSILSFLPLTLPT